jgi:peptidoglycan hydrolase FlgJ
MAISPASDIILDVARAADPGRAMATTRALANSSSAAPADFTLALNSFHDSATARELSYQNPALFGARTESPERKAAVGLESVLLKNVIDQMLPKDAADVFGSGVAGDVWRSMLSDKIANQIAKSGALKISDRLFTTHSDLLHPAKLSGPARSIDKS